jgi:hypothetical protein
MKETPDVSKEIQLVAQLNDVVQKQCSTYIEKFINQNPTTITALVKLAECDSHINTPLHIAARIYSADNPLLLLLRNIPAQHKNKVVNQPDLTGKSSLFIAAMNGFIDNVITLLEHGADILYQDAAGNTALHWAAMAKNRDIDAEMTIPILISAGAPIDLQNKAGKTPLCLAALQGKKKTVLKLLSLGADASMIDANSIDKIHAKKSEPGYYATYPSEIIQILDKAIKKKRRQ